MWRDLQVEVRARKDFVSRCGVMRTRRSRGRSSSVMLLSCVEEEDQAVAEKVALAKVIILA